MCIATKYSVINPTFVRTVCVFRWDSLLRGTQWLQPGQMYRIEGAEKGALRQIPMHMSRPFPSIPCQYFLLSFMHVDKNWPTLYPKMKMTDNPTIALPVA